MTMRKNKSLIVAFLVFATFAFAGDADASWRYTSTHHYNNKTTITSCWYGKYSSECTTTTKPRVQKRRYYNTRVKRPRDTAELTKKCAHWKVSMTDETIHKAYSGTANYFYKRKKCETLLKDNEASTSVVVDPVNTIPLPKQRTATSSVKNCE